MKKILSVFCIVTIVLSTAGCGFIDFNGVADIGESVNLDLEDLGDIGEVLFEKDDSNNTYTGYSLVIENIKGEKDSTFVGDITIKSDDSDGEVTYSKINDNIEVNIDTDNKIIEIKGSGVYKEDSVDIEIQGNISKIKCIDTSLEADIKINTAKDVNIIIMGSLSGDIDVNAQNLFLAVNGAGAFDIEGVAKLTDILLNGAGKIEASDLIVENSVVELNGAGLCEVNVTNDLKATINGVGQIKYSGNPANVDKSVKGLGRITQDN